VQVGQGRAYAWRNDSGAPWRVGVVDLATGTVEQELSLANPTRLVLGEPN